MLKPLHIALGSALLLTMLAQSWGQSQPNPEPNKQPQASQQPATPDQRGTEKSPAFVKIIPTPKTASETAQEAKDREEKAKADVWIIRWTGAVALFTLVLAGVGAWQGVQLKRSVDLARKEFIASHHPRIRVRRITTVGDLTPDSAINLTIEAANIGDSDATVTEMGLDVYIADTPFNARPRPYTLPKVEAGREMRISYSTGRTLSDAEVDAIEVGTSEWRLLGIINYLDDNKVMRSTSLARVYNRAMRRFVPVTEHDPDADREFEN